MGDPGGVVGAVVVAAGAVAITRRVGAWARRRCDEALDAAHRLPLDRPRAYVLRLYADEENLGKSTQLTSPCAPVGPAGRDHRRVGHPE
ncbi:MAG: hypothetical protein ACRDY7_02570 [Acidimicrobiia bacterium]